LLLVKTRLWRESCVVCVRRISFPQEVSIKGSSMKGTAMKNIKGLLLGIGAAAFLSSAAIAADVLVKKGPAAAPAPATPLWDLAFGAAVMSDYNFRGVSQSNREFSFGA
jgi:hypothetical protein